MSRKISYIQYVNKTIMNQSVATVIWTAMATYTIIARGSIKADIPILEMFVFIGGIMGTYIAFRQMRNLKSVLIFNISTDLFIDLILIYLIYRESTEIVAYTIYAFFIMHAILSPIVREIKRKFEMNVHGQYHDAITSYHKKSDTWNVLSHGIGSLIAVIFLTFLDMRPEDFAKILIVCGLFCTIWNAYWLRKL